MTWTLFKNMLIANWKRLVLIILIISGSLSLFVLISLFVFNVEQELQREVKPLVGADIVIEWTQEISQEVLDDIEAISQDLDVRMMQVVEFVTNVQQPWTDPKLIKVRWVDPWFPLYWDLILDNKIWSYDAWIRVDQQTYAQFTSGDSIRLGELNFALSWVITELPVTSVSLFDEWRTLIMPRSQVVSTQLTSLGSRVEYELFIQTASDEDTKILLERLENVSSLEWVYEVEDAASRLGQIRRITDEFQRFMTITLIITFVLVATTIFISVRTFFAKEQRNIAILKLLWQRNSQTLALYVSMFAFCFIVGRLVSWLLWWWAMQWMAWFELSQNFVFRINSVREAGIISILLACISLSLPLLDIFSKDPLALLSPQRVWLSRRVLALQAWISVVWMRCMYVVSLHDWWWWVVFVVWVSCIVALLSVYVLFVLKAIHRFASRWKKAYFLWFDGIRASIAPWNQSLLMNLWLLIAVLCLLVISGISHNFLQQIRVIQDDQASLYILNVLPDDVAWIEKEFPESDLYDTIGWRIESINSIWLADWLWTIESRGRGEFTREFNITSISFDDKDYIVWSSPMTWEVSLDEEFAGRLGVGIGDSIRFFIQWRSFDLRVSSFRRVVRDGIQPFFYIQFPQEQFANAPKTYFRLLNVVEEDKTQVKNNIIQNLWPHISFVDTSDIVETITDISAKITIVIQVLVWFLLLFVAASIFVCLESMKVLKEQKIQLYTYLWATQTMLKKTLWIEQLVVFGLAICTAMIWASILVRYIFSRSELLDRDIWVLMYMFLLVCGVCVWLVVMIRGVYSKLF